METLSRCSKPTCEFQVLATADIFNDHFCRFPTKLFLMWLVQYQLLSTWTGFCNGTASHSTLEFVPVETVSLIISSLCIKKASVADGLPTWFIRASPYMARLVTVLINKCINSSSVPSGCCHTCS